MATQAEIEAEGVAKEVAANKRRTDAGAEGSASDYEAAANIRSKEAGFSSAAAQEEDANRRARRDGFANAAEKEIAARERKSKKSASGTAGKPPTYTAEEAPSAIDETDYATQATAKMPKLGKVPEMGKAAQRTVHPQELVEWRMNQMMKQTNPYIQAAQTNAKQAAAASGLLNTSIAASAGLDAAIKSILPIAQQDAATLFTQSLENQKVVNEFLMQSFLTRSQFKLEEFGLKVNTYNQGLQRSHEKSENSLQRWWSGEQNRMDRELNAWTNQFNADVSKQLAEMGYTHDASEREKDCRERATATFNSQIAAITESWSTDKISHDSYMTQLESAQDQYKAQMNSCKT